MVEMSLKDEKWNYSIGYIQEKSVNHSSLGYWHDCPSMATHLVHLVTNGKAVDRYHYCGNNNNYRLVYKKLG